MRVPKQFMKFAVVGSINTAINLAVLYTLTDFFNVYYMVSAVFAFIIAVTNSFIMNALWTFQSNIREEPAKRYSKFISISLLALGLNLSLLYILTELLKFYYLFSQVIAIGISFWINFIGNKKWTFGN